VKHRPVEKIAEYRKLVTRYAETLDLISPVGIEQLDHHIATSYLYAAVIEQLVPAPSVVLDLGSGAGLPGVILAIELSPTEVFLVERRRRRAAFLSIAVSQLALTNAKVIASDVDRLTSEHLFGRRADVVTAQAVGTFADVHRVTEHLSATTVTLISRKGPGWQDEVSVLTSTQATAVDVVAKEPLANRGTLVAVRLTGGKRCRS
jgi:16S rRNA (guanine527-N7)-methyltransferase